MTTFLADNDPAFSGEPLGRPLGEVLGEMKAVCEGAVAYPEIIDNGEDIDPDAALGNSKDEALGVAWLLEQEALDAAKERAGG